MVLSVKGLEWIIPYLQVTKRIYLNYYVQITEMICRGCNYRYSAALFFPVEFNFGMHFRWQIPENPDIPEKKLIFSD